jgi:hypothetical protein
MAERDPQFKVARRSFLSRFGVGAAAFGAAFGASRELTAQAPAAPAAPKHAEDEWLERPGAKHRAFFDTTFADAFGQAIFFANNFYTASRNSYQLKDEDNAIVICVRHESTAFGYDDAMWAKYGSILVERAGHFVDPKTKQAPTVNVYMASGYGGGLRNNGVTLDSVLKRGLSLAVCQMATRANAGLIAQRTGKTADEIFKELSEHLVPNSHLVPAGIVAVSRAQERGYSFTYVA